MAGIALKPPVERKPEEQSRLEQLCRAHESVAAALALTQGFADLIREAPSEEAQAKLSQWLQAAIESGIAAFKSLAMSLKQDLAAVEAAIRLPWSNGPVEGSVNRVKAIKRQMYGRAKFDLLRIRVLVPS